ncbi:MAG: hypothetical protein ACM3XN_02510 [Chloroflexota bacterium]
MRQQQTTDAKGRKVTVVTKELKEMTVDERLADAERRLEAIEKKLNTPA